MSNQPNRGSAAMRCSRCLVGRFFRWPFSFGFRIEQDCEVSCLRADQRSFFVFREDVIDAIFADIVPKLGSYHDGKGYCVGRRAEPTMGGDCYVVTVTYRKEPAVTGRESTVTVRPCESGLPSAVHS